MAYTYDRVLKDVAIDDAELLVRDARGSKATMGRPLCSKI